MILRCLASAGVAWLLVGCVGTQTRGYLYNEVVIVNQTHSALTDVTVAATDTGRLFSCGNVAPRGICSNQFAPRDYSGNPIEVTWSIAGGNRRSEIIEVEIPQNIVAQVPMRGVLVINNRGDVEAYLQQVAPGPHL